jgi:aminomethyltransferase
MLGVKNDNLKCTPLYQDHLQQGAKMLPFAGWKMPVQYSGILAEHKAVRQSVGLFDVSHMGEFYIAGRGALEFLQMLTVNDVSRLQIGQAQYNALCFENGTMIDDIIIYKKGFDSFLLCVNASNRDKNYDWFAQHRPAQGVVLENVSHEYAQIAVQGPQSRQLIGKLADLDLTHLPYYHFVEGKILGVPSLIARTGYTGELGYELYLPTAPASKIWNALLEVGKSFGVLPCGLGARDLLRLECGYLLYGNDMDETTTALECGLSWLISFEKPFFFGKEALLQQKKIGFLKKLIAFEMQDKAIARQKYFVYLDENQTEPVGSVTSGGPSPSLLKNIGLAYIPSAQAKIGTEIWIEIRGVKKRAQIVKKPFFDQGSLRK